MNPPAQITVSICIVAPKGVDLDQVTLLTGVKPTRIWRQRDALIAAKHQHLDFQEWQLEIPHYPAGDFDCAINGILDMIWTSRDVLVHFCQRNRAHVTIHVKPLAGSDVIVFAIDDPETIARVASLRGRIHFHIDGPPTS